MLNFSSIFPRFSSNNNKINLNKCYPKCLSNSNNNCPNSNSNSNKFP